MSLGPLMSTTSQDESARHAQSQENMRRWAMDEHIPMTDWRPGVESWREFCVRKKNEKQVEVCQ